MDEIKLALEMNKLVHNECEDVPHDIGLKLLEIVKRNVNEQLRQPPVSGQLLFSPDDIERIVNAKSTFNGKQFRKMFEEK